MKPKITIVGLIALLAVIVSGTAIAISVLLIPDQRANKGRVA